jgi:hypothetical protein
MDGSPRTGKLFDGEESEPKKGKSLFPPGLNNKTELCKTVDKHEQLTLKSYFAVPPKANIKVFELSFDIYPIPRSFIFQVSE